MKTMNYVKICLLCVLTLGLMSCGEDQRHIESVITGRTWTGDVGLNADNGEPVFSSFIFKDNGFGIERQYYVSDGAFYAEFDFQWIWENNYDSNLILDYGRLGMSYMDNLRISGNRLSGTFYLSDGDRGYDFVLEMDY